MLESLTEAEPEENGPEAADAAAPEGSGRARDTRQRPPAENSARIFSGGGFPASY